MFNVTVVKNRIRMIKMIKKFPKLELCIYSKKVNNPLKVTSSLQRNARYKLEAHFTDVNTNPKNNDVT